MNTIVGYTAGQCDDDNGKVLQSLLLLARRFMGTSDSSIRRRYATDDRFMPNVPQRVWKRHSALLSMLIQQSEAPKSSPGDAK